MDHFDLMGDFMVSDNPRIPIPPPLGDHPVRGPVDKLLKILKELIASRFFGIVELRFEDGRVVNIRKTENIKP